MDPEMKKFLSQLAKKMTFFSGFKTKMTLVIAGREASACAHWHYGETEFNVFVDNELTHNGTNIVHIYWTKNGKEKSFFIERNATIAAASFLAMNGYLEEYMEAV